MSLKINTLINYASKAYLGVVGIIISPILIHILGTESFGLISIFTLIQTWLQLLDMGLSNTLTRETAKYNTGNYSTKSFLSLMDKIRKLYFLIFIFIIFSGWFFTDYITQQWLNNNAFEYDQLVFYTHVMIVSVAFRWLSIPFRSILIGFSEYKNVAKIDVLITTYRTLVCLFVLFFIKSSLTIYFIIQLSSSFLYFILFFYISYKKINRHTYSSSSLGTISIRDTVKFSSLMLISNLFWLVLSQFDKLYISRMISLSDYGMFTIAVQLSSIIMILSAPFSIALLPKLVELHEKKYNEKYKEIYTKAFYFIMSLLIPVAIVIFVYAKEILYFWSQSTEIADYGYNIVKLYVIGNLLLAISAFAYYILFTYGNLKPHVYMLFLSTIIIIPLYIFSVNYSGPIGAGFIWVVYNIIIVCIWLPFIQRKYSGLKIQKYLFFTLFKVSTISSVIIYIGKYIPYNIVITPIVIIVSLSLSIILSLMLEPAFFDKIKNRIIILI